MSTILEDFEALMPEPEAFIAAGDLQLLRYGMHSIAGRRTAPDDLGLYTADQVREAMKAVAERCAVLCDAERSEFTKQSASNNGRESDFAFGSVNSAERLAAAIRAQTGGEA